ncbi:MAG: carboxypeptidase-like regulatory domain-containing protein [Planctomycetaceae bacterium]|nr:carboxypeptidase-like regulatory domain-containing protein [Planctomycetaceae bacterium]
MTMSSGSAFRPFLCLTPLLSGVLFGLVGCGGSSAPPPLPSAVVEGKVLMDGKPVIGAQVVFVPVETTKGFGGMTVSDAEGAFKIERSGAPGVTGLPLGKYRVTVEPYHPPEDPTLAAEFVVPAGATKSIPAVYAARDRTPLDAMVAAGGGTFTFELNSKAR